MIHVDAGVNDISTDVLARRAVIDILSATRVFMRYSTKSPLSVGLGNGSANLDDSILFNIIDLCKQSS